MKTPQSGFWVGGAAPGAAAVGAPSLGAGGASGSAGSIVGVGGRPENIVHQTMNTNSKPAPKASRKISHIQQAKASWIMATIVGSLVACSAPPRIMAPQPERPAQGAAPTPPTPQETKDEDESEQHTHEGNTTPAPIPPASN